MSYSGQMFVASTEGSQMTLYAAMRRMGIPLSPEQERCQNMLEKMYPAYIQIERNPDLCIEENITEA